MDQQNNNRLCHIYGKKNCNGPAGWENDDNAPWYDPNGKYGGEIKGALANGYTVEEMREYLIPLYESVKKIGYLNTIRKFKIDHTRKWLRTMF